MLSAETKEGLKSCLEKVGVSEGALVFVHSFLGAFGRIEFGPPDVLDVLESLVGKTGGLIFPTYNYGFFDGTSRDFQRAVQQGEKLAEFEVAKITTDYVDLKLGTNAFQLRIRGELSKRGDEAWQASTTSSGGYSRTSSYSGSSKSSTSSGTTSTTSSSSSSGGDSDDERKKRLLELLKKRRSGQ